MARGRRWQGHSLLEEDRTETSVEGADTLVLEHLGETSNQAVGIGGLGDETDTGGLERAQGDVSEELGGGGRGEVDGSAVLRGGLVAEAVDPLLLEEFVTAELEGSLEEVPGKGRADTSQESASTLVLDDLAETANHATVVGLGVELDTGLDAVFLQRNVSIHAACKRARRAQLRSASQTKGVADDAICSRRRRDRERKKHTHRRE